MKGMSPSALRSWAIALLALGGIGTLLAHSWYSEEACATAQWKCSLGDVGLSASFYLLPLGAMVALIALVTWLVEADARRS